MGKWVRCRVASQPAGRRHTLRCAETGTLKGFDWRDEAHWLEVPDSFAACVVGNDGFEISDTDPGVLSDVEINDDSVENIDPKTARGAELREFIFRKTGVRPGQTTSLDALRAQVAELQQ